MTGAKTIIGLMLVSAWLVTLPVQAQSTETRLKIEAFTVSDRPFVRTDAAATCCTVIAYRLDGLDRLTGELSEGLPNNPALAEQIVQKEFAERKDEFRAAARDHAEVLEKAVSYGLTRYPALVFNDGESVIYGVTDLNAALAIYRRAAP